MNRRWFGVLLVLLGLLGLAGCAQRGAPPREPSGGLEPQKGAVEAPLPVSPEQGLAANAPRWGAGEDEVPSVSQRLVVRNATLDIVVQDPEATMNALVQVAANLGGYVVSSELSTLRLRNGREVPQATVKLRVPAERFEQALQAIREQALRVSGERISGQDVTEEYVDLQARVKNLRAAEQQLQEIMDQATRTEDVLQVYRELTNVRGEIERLEGRIRYLQQSAAMSAIEVHLIPDEAAQPLRIGGWEPQGVAKRAIEMLLLTLQGIATLVIWVVLYLLPVLLVLVALFWPLYRLGRWVWRRWGPQRDASSPGKSVGKRNAG